MGESHPWMLLALLAGTAGAARLWLQDLQSARRGVPSPRALPGATPASPTAILAACGGALALLALETAGECALGLTARQNRITVLFGCYTIAAAFLEELVFRGFIVVQGRGRAALAAGCIGASLLFAVLHPFLWGWNDGALHWRADAKAWFSTGMIFAGSLWFYAVRFWRLNPARSLLPCIAAHAAKNAGVFAVKAAQGFVVGWW